MVITVPLILNYINDIRYGVYHRKEFDFEQAARSFVTLNYEYLPYQVDDVTYITIDTLVHEEVMNNIIDSKTGLVCEGYVLITRTTETTLQYDPYINCADSFTSIGFSSLDAVNTTISIGGDSPVVHQQGTPYVDEGAFAIDPIDGNITSSIIVTNPVNVNVAATYTVTYSVTNSRAITVTASRTVTVKDSIPPVVVVIGDNPINHIVNTTYVDLGAAASDNIDGNITANITTTTNLLVGILGSYTRTYSVTDAGGNTASATRIINVTDNSAPTIAISPNNNAQYKQTHTTVVTIDDNYSINGGVLKYKWMTTSTPLVEADFTGASTFTSGATISTSVISGIQSVSYYLHILAKDATGNVAISVSGAFKIDVTGPTCTLTGGSATWTNGSRTVSATCADSLSGCNGTVPSYTYSTQITTTTAGAGGNNVGGVVTDLAGNTTTCAANQTVNIDKTAPTCAVSGGSTSWINTSRTITGTCSDTGGSGCNGTNPSYVFANEINTITAGPGTSGGTITISDNANNTATCAANQTVKIDKTAPVLTYTSCSTCGAWHDHGGYTYWNAAADTMSGIHEQYYATSSNMSGQILLNDKAGTTSAYSDSIYISASGNYRVYLRAIDEAGNVSNIISAPSNFMIDYTPPACISSGGNSAWTTGNRTIVGTCSDSQSGCVPHDGTIVGQIITPMTKVYSSDINTTTAGIAGYGDAGYWGYWADYAGNSTTDLLTQEERDASHFYINCPLNQTVRIDKTAPVITSLTFSYFGGYAGMCVVNWGTATDAMSGLSTTPYSVDSGATWSSTKDTIADKGYYVRIRDVAGNYYQKLVSC